MDGEAPLDIGLGAELRALDADVGADDSLASSVLDDTRELPLSTGLLLGTEDADGLAIYGEDEGRALEQTFDGLLWAHLIEGDRGLVARRAELGLIVDLVA